MTVSDFDAMKAGMLAIRPWLSCRYIKNTHMEMPWNRPYLSNKKDKREGGGHKFPIWDNIDYEQLLHTYRHRSPCLQVYVGKQNPPPNLLYKVKAFLKFQVLEESTYFMPTSAKKL